MRKFGTGRIWPPFGVIGCQVAPGAALIRSKLAASQPPQVAICRRASTGR